MISVGMETTRHNHWLFLLICDRYFMTLSLKLNRVSVFEILMIRQMIDWSTFVLSQTRWKPNDNHSYSVPFSIQCYLVNPAAPKSLNHSATEFSGRLTHCKRSLHGTSIWLETLPGGWRGLAANRALGIVPMLTSRTYAADIHTVSLMKSNNVTRLARSAHMQRGGLYAVEW